MPEINMKHLQAREVAQWLIEHGAEGATYKDICDWRPPTLYYWLERRDWQWNAEQEMWTRNDSPLLTADC